MSKKVLATKEIVVANKGKGGKALIASVVLVSATYVTIKNAEKIMSIFKKDKTSSEEDGDVLICNETFNGKDISYENKEFHGAVIKNLCSGIKLNLGDAIITDDVNIKCRNIMSGISIIVPDYVNVKVHDVSIMGGLSNGVPGIDDESAPTIHIYSKNIMGGIDIRVKGDQEDNYEYGDSEEECDDLEKQSSEEPTTNEDIVADDIVADEETEALAEETEDKDVEIDETITEENEASLK